jgi:hypothetical protein
MTNNKKYIYYFISICLIFWYITVLYWSLYPKVGLEYKMYYLEKTLSDWPGYSGLRYNLGDVLFFGNKPNVAKLAKNRGKGWCDSTEWGNWINGKTAELFFILNNSLKTSDLRLTMLARATAPEGSQTMHLYVNDVLVGTKNIVDSISKEYEFVLPKKVLEKSVAPMHLKLVLDDESYSKNSRLRKGNVLPSIALQWLKIEKTP